MHSGALGLEGLGLEGLWGGGGRVLGSQGFKRFRCVRCHAHLHAPVGVPFVVLPCAPCCFGGFRRALRSFGDFMGTSGGLGQFRLNVSLEYTSTHDTYPYVL